MAKIKVTIPEGIDLKVKNSKMSAGFLNKLEEGTYQVMEVHQMKPTANDASMGFCFINIKTKSDEQMKLGLYTGDPNIDCSNLDKGIETVVVNGKKEISFE
jgi:hypothetical protein